MLCPFVVEYKRMASFSSAVSWDFLRTAFTGTIPFHLTIFLSYEQFAKYPEGANFAPCLGSQWLESLQLQGALPPDPLTRSSTPGPRWGLLPQTPVRLALRARHGLHPPPNFKCWLRPWFFQLIDFRFSCFCY